MRYDFDLLVVGAGSGGVRGARIAAGHGARVAIVEEFRYGGTCVIRGCIPKKLFAYAAGFSSHFADAAGFGWTVPAPCFRWRTLVENKDRELDRLEAIYRRMLVSSGVTTIKGRGRLVDGHSVEVDGRIVTAQTLLVATGGKPSRLGIAGEEIAITSNEVFDLPELPRRVLVVGGGYIACEFSSIFRGLGSQVTQMLRGGQVLRGFDDDVREHLAEEMRIRGVDIRTRTELDTLLRTPTGIRAVTRIGEHIDTDCVLVAVGRHPNTDNLGLEAAGVAMTAGGAIVVDERSQTSVPEVYAVGDVTNRVALTPVALAEAHAFADSVYGGRPRVVDHSAVASTVFSHPNVATVGLTEQEARRRYSNVDVYRSVFRPLKHTLSGHADRVLMKLVVDADSDRLLGCHMVGEDAGEIIQGFAVALKMGASKTDLDSTIGIHPTAAEEFVTMRQKSPPRGTG
jgi:glutathione reductase (NADPH)